MSLLQWKELAKKKTDLGKKINVVNETILRNKLDEGATRIALKKAFQAMTSEFNDVVIPDVRQKVPDYGIAIEDEVPDYHLENLFDEGVLPDTQKQVVPKPPTYEESLKDVLSGKNKYMLIFIYLPEEPQEMPREYEDEEIDYALEEEDNTNMILDGIGLLNYDGVEMKPNAEEMTLSRRKN